MQRSVSRHISRAQSSSGFQPFSAGNPTPQFPQGRLGLPQFGVIALVALLMLPAIIVQFEWRLNGALSIGMIAVAMLISVFVPKFRRVVMALSVLASLRYIYWRAAHTLSTGTWTDVAVTTALFAAEIYGVTILLLGYFQTIKLVRRKSEPLPANEAMLPTVDVFIPTFNEDIDILRRTAACAVAIDYPKKKVFLLDDGHREAVRALAAEVGCGYITRNDNRNAKAGNINNAMRLTNGELIMILDADHVPVRSFLSETVGFFSDSEVALVQTPHHFFNPDPFQRNLSVEDKVAQEGDFFYHVVQVGNDYWNSAFFCGSAGIIRRSALEEIGGIATETVTEDAHTSLRIHARGYKSVYYSKPLIAGLATERFSYHVGQRMRWARGMIQILRIQNPLWTRGLKLPQRLNYFNAMLHFLFGFPRLIFILAPISYLLFGLHPVTGWGLEVLLYALPHIVLSTIAASMVSGNFRHSFWAEIYEAAIAAIILPVTLLAFISPKFGKFNVTNKGARIEKDEFDTKHALPTIILTVLAVASIIAIPYRWLTSPTEHSSVVINGVWTLYNLIILTAAVIAARDKAQLRNVWRVTREYVATVLLPHQRGASVRVIDLSETGAKLLFDKPLPLPRTFALRITGESGEMATVESRIAWREMVEHNRAICGVEFVRPSAETRHALIRLMFSGSESWIQRSTPADRPFRSYLYILTSVFRLGSRHSASRRSAPRLARSLNAQLTPENGKPLRVVTRDISEHSAAVLVDGNVKLSSRVTLQVPALSGRVIDVPGRVVGVRDSSQRDNRLTVIEFDELAPADSQSLASTLYGGRLANTFSVIDRTTPSLTTEIPATVTVPPIPTTIRVANSHGNGNGHTEAKTNGHSNTTSPLVVSPPLRPNIVERFKVKPEIKLVDFDFDDSQITEVPPPPKRLFVQVIANRRNRTYYKPGSDYYRMMMSARPTGGSNWVIFASEHEALAAGYRNAQLAS
ncbi:MAG TPA: UDP-forming cellulose synthase catalytic subunit [Blastocatellia bacterium]|nr:UDP-forming cellulose synthase catalytic subunit [Blastocatellia bacterium]